MCIICEFKMCLFPPRTSQSVLVNDTKRLIAPDVINIGVSVCSNGHLHCSVQSEKE